MEEKLFILAASIQLVPTRKMLKNGQNYTLVFPVGNEAYADDFSCLSHWEVRNPLPLYNVGVTNKNAF